MATMFLLKASSHCVHIDDAEDKDKGDDNESPSLISLIK